MQFKRFHRTILWEIIEVSKAINYNTTSVNKKYRLEKKKKLNDLLRPCFLNDFLSRIDKVQ